MDILLCNSAFRIIFHVKKIWSYLKMFKFKKGELTTAQIVTLVMLIASFAVILYFLFTLDLGGTSEKDICHNSVAMRSSPVVPGETIPLDCRTSYVCITEDGSCEKWANTEKKNVKTKDDVYKVLAEQMSDCWWMFGEGKLDYIGKTDVHANLCSICSQVVFDDSLISISSFRDGNISKDNFYEYLSTNKQTGKDITYSEYFFGTKNLSELKKMVSEQNNGIGGTFGKINLDKPYYVMMGITSEVSASQWILKGIASGEIAVVSGAFVIGLLGVSNPIGWVATTIVIGVAGATSSGGIAKLSDSIHPEISAIVVKGNGINNNFMAPTIIESDNDKFKALNCADVKTLS
jgi:hypothetical protein